MSRSTQWLSLIAGVIILGYGVYKLFEDKDYTLFLLGLLIAAFSVSKLVKSSIGQKEPRERGR